MSILVYSPHLDDAVLSVGQIIASYPGAVVATAFAGYPEPGGPATTYDERCGFESGWSAVHTRRAEDVQALASLGAVPMHLEFLDAQYDTSRDEDSLVKRMKRRICEVHDHVSPDHTFIPLGISHPDHDLLARVCLSALVGRDEVYVYADLPYRVQFPELTAHVFRRRVMPASSGVQFVNAGRDQLPLKMRAVFCYKSQLWGVDEWCTFVPERIYGKVRW